MFQGIWCRLRMFFSQVSAVRCALSWSCPCCEAPSVVLSRTVWGRVLTEPGASYFCYIGCLHPTALRLQMSTCWASKLRSWVSAASTLPTESIPQSLRLPSEVLISTSYPQRLLLYSVSGPQQCFLYSKTFISACRPLRVPKTLNLQRSKLLL